MKEIIWITQHSRDVYSGIDVRGVGQDGKDLHFSYHKDGNYVSTIGGEKTLIKTGPPTDDFKGIVQLYDNAISCDILEWLGQTVEDTDSRSILIDVRNFKHGGFGCNLFLLESGRDDLYSILARDSPLTGPSLHDSFLFKDCDPWLAILMHDVIH